METPLLCSLRRPHPLSTHVRLLSVTPVGDSDLLESLYPDGLIKTLLQNLVEDLSYLVVFN